MGRIEDALFLYIEHHFAHQFAHQSGLLPYAPLERSPHSSKVRSPIRKHFVNSLTNSLTNHSYHMRPQISHLTVLKFAHQFAPSKLFVRLAPNLILAHSRARTSITSITSHQRCSTESTRSKAAQTISCVYDRWVASKMLIFS